MISFGTEIDIVILMTTCYSVDVLLLSIIYLFTYTYLYTLWIKDKVYLGHSRVNTNHNIYNI